MAQDRESKDPAPAYRYLDHTSDLGMEIYGSTLPELFANAARAVFENILNLEAVEQVTSRQIQLSGPTCEELFLNWLRELLFQFATDFFVVKTVPSVAISNPSGSYYTLTATVQGEQFDRRRHQVKIEIKTPTYHKFRIIQDSTGYRATVIFDV